MLALGRRKRAERVGAAAAAVAIHGLVFTLLLATAKGSLFTGGNVTGESIGADVVPILLAGTPGDGRAASKPEDDLQHLLAQLRTDSSLVIVEPSKVDPKPSTRLDDLFAELDRAHSSRSDADSGGRSQNDKGGKGGGSEGDVSGDQGRKAERSSPKPDSASGEAASSGTLLGQIERCWNKLPNHSPVPVTLEIALSPDGLIATPPKIIRPSAEAPTERRLLSEARALEAVRACVPYHGVDSAGNSHVFRVNFDTSK